jgi:hypothetical protein
MDREIGQSSREGRVGGERELASMLFGMHPKYAQRYVILVI